MTVMLCAWKCHHAVAACHQVHKYHQQTTYCLRDRISCGLKAHETTFSFLVQEKLKWQMVKGWIMSAKCSCKLTKI